MNMKYLFPIVLGLFLCLNFALFADEPETAGKKHLLRYQFHPDEVLKWDVIQQNEMKTQVSSQKELTSSHCRSTKVWTVLEVQEDGTTLLEYSVQDAELRNKKSDQDAESMYDSKQDAAPTPEFQEIADSLGKPLAHITINTRGELLKKVQKTPYAAATEENRIAIPIPELPIAIGETWEAVNDVVLPQSNGTVKKIDLRQRFTLEKVENGIATIKFRTLCFTPIDDPKVKMQMIDKEPEGTIRFDIDAGRNIDQQSDIRKNVRNWTDGTASSVSYQSRFIEKFVTEK